MPIRSRHVLAVQRLDIAVDYLRNCLGFTGGPICEGWALLSLEDFVVMLGECPDEMPASATGDHAYFAQLIIDDVDDCHERFRQNGALLESAPRDRPWGLREFVVRTPDGHRMVFAGESARRSDSA